MLITMYAQRQLARLSAYGVGVYSDYTNAAESLNSRRKGSVIVQGDEEFLVMTAKQYSKEFTGYETI